MQACIVFFSRICLQQGPLFPTDEAPGWQDDPAIVIAHRHEIVRGDTESGEGANEGCAVIVIADGTDIAHQLPSGEAVFDQRAKGALCGQVLKEEIRPIFA